MTISPTLPGKSHNYLQGFTSAPNVGNQCVLIMSRTISKFFIFLLKLLVTTWITCWTEIWVEDYVILVWRFGNIFKPNLWSSSCKIVQNGDLCNDLNTCLSSSMEYFPEICYQDTCSPNQERTGVFLPFFCWNKIRLCFKKSFEKLNGMLMSGFR